jgi:hypothetical protein
VTPSRFQDFTSEKSSIKKSSAPSKTQKASILLPKPDFLADLSGDAGPSEESVPIGTVAAKIKFLQGGHSSLTPNNDAKFSLPPQETWSGDEGNRALTPTDRVVEKIMALPRVQHSTPAENTPNTTHPDRNSNGENRQDQNRHDKGDFTKPGECVHEENEGGHTNMPRFGKKPMIVRQRYNLGRLASSNDLDVSTPDVRSRRPSAVPSLRLEQIELEDV